MGSMTRRTPLLLLFAMTAALALSACGSGGGDDPAKKARAEEDKAYEGALKFSKCMREHGVDMPDPQRGANGGIMLKSGKPGAGAGEKGNSGGPGDPKFKAGEKACGKYLTRGGGKAPSPAEQAKQRDAFVGYSRCMRSKGINMPDPKFSGNGIQMTLGRGVNPDSPKFKAADTACHPLLAAVEPKGMKPGGGPSDSKSAAPAGSAATQ
jgi:hypothetical protein